MSLETTLTQAIEAIDRLRQTVDGKVQEIDSRIASKENEVTQFLLNAPNSYMNKTFYVDAVNGDDANSGTGSAPFATLKKAVDSVPTGGFGFIYLASNINVDTTITVGSKKGIAIIGLNYDTTNSTPSVSLNFTSTGQFFIIGNSFIRMHSVTLNLVKPVDVSAATHWQVPFKSGYGTNMIGIGYSGRKVILNFQESMNLINTEYAFTSVVFQNCVLNNPNAATGINTVVSHSDGSALLKAAATVNNDTTNINLPANGLII